MAEFELSLVKAFSWSLRDIDETDVESLFEFVHHINAERGMFARKQVFCDQVSWL